MPEIYALIVKKKDIFKMNVHKFFMKIITIRKSNIIKSEQIIIQSIGRALRKHSDKKIATIFDIVDVFEPSNMNNILYKHYKEREKFYKNRKYPYKEIKINL